MPALESDSATKLLAGAFWLWSLLIVVVGGFFGAALNCESGIGCKTGFPSWLRPWTWGEYSVFPEVLYTAVPGLILASVFVVLVLFRRRLPAMGAFILTLGLLSYPFFGGFTNQGRVIVSFGALLGLATLARYRRGTEAS